MKKAIQDKDGKPIVVDMTEQEELELFAFNRPVWHNSDKVIQVIIPEKVKRDLLILNSEHEILGNHPDVAMLLDYVKNISTLSVNEAGSLYIYLSELFPQHKAFLESFGIQINVKP